MPQNDEYNNYGNRNADEDRETTRTKDTTPMDTINAYARAAIHRNRYKLGDAINNVFRRMLQDIQNTGASMEDIAAGARRNGVKWTAQSVCMRLLGRTRCDRMDEALVILRLHNEAMCLNQTLSDILAEAAKTADGGEKADIVRAREYVDGGTPRCGRLIGYAVEEKYAAKRLGVTACTFARMHKMVFDCTLDEHMRRLGCDDATPNERKETIRLITDDMRRMSSGAPGYTLA